jgi:hypothetical protein
MKNITLAIDGEMLVLGREYAKRHNISFNALVRKSLEKTIRKSSKDWLDDIPLISMITTNKKQRERL